MSIISDLLVYSDCDIRAALEQLQRSGRGILLLVDKNDILLRTVTDGDLRRLLLAGNELNAPLSLLPNAAPHVLHTPYQPADALAAMNRYEVDDLPLIDSAGRPVGLVSRRDLDSKILLSTPHLGEHEMSYIEEALRTNWIAPLGPNVDAFETELAAYVGVKHAAAVSSGTAAIHLALRLLDVGPGDTVFCSSLTFVASANPILYQGAIPVFIDAEPETWNMSAVALDHAMQNAVKTGALPKAVIVVNLYGQSADLDAISQICDRYKVPIVEDAAESLGATYKGRHSGTLGRIGVYSFNGNKIITTSGGGMLISDDAAYITRARHLATQAKGAAAHYEHEEVGYNYRMSNILAGIGRGQLRVLEQRVASRRAVFEHYSAALSGIDEIEWMPEAAFGKSTRWLTAFTARTLEPTAIIAALAAEGIEARRVWKPMHLQPLFRGTAYFKHADRTDVSADLFDRGICLPSGSNLSEADLERVVKGVRNAVRAP